MIPLDVAHKELELFLGRKIELHEPEEADTELAKLWYESGQEDFSLYERDDYLISHLHYLSRSLDAIREVYRYFDVHQYYPALDTIIDYGFGLGYTTLALSWLYPEARVIGVNWPGRQLDFNQQLAPNKNNLEFIPESKLYELAGPNTYLVTLELFEHFKNPLAETRRLVELLNPLLIADASSFSHRSLGHFDVYDFDGKPVPGPGSAWGNLLLGKELKRLGYARQPQFRFRARPRIWLRAYKSIDFWGGNVLSTSQHVYPRDKKLCATRRCSRVVPAG